MRANQLSLLLALAGSSLLAGGCGGDSLTLPSEGEAARIEVWGTWAEGNQQGRVGAVLSESLAVRVTDTKGRPVIGVPIEFAFADGSGSSAAPTPVTSSDSGIARTSITLGTRVGLVTGQARVVVGERQTPVQTDFVATALPTNASEIIMVSGADQTGAVGTPLLPLVVQVNDAFGNPVSGMQVDWTMTGGGELSATSTQTDAQGQTSVVRTLGPAAGPQSTSALANGLVGSPVVFNHTATAGNAARVIVVSGNGQQAAPGTRLPQDLVVEVLDAENNPIVGRAVSWVIGTGEGSVDPATSNTDGQGRATTQWTLGDQPGRNTLSAVVSGVGLATFNATATLPKTSSSTSITSDEPEPSTVGQAVQVQVQVSGSGGTPTGTVNVTGENASAPCTITLSNGTGTCSLTFNAEGQQRITATYNGDARFNGSNDEENHRVEPIPPHNNAPTAAFGPPTCVAGQPCQFNDGSSDSDGSIAGWAWEFGDPVNGASTQKDPLYTYADPGTYTVKLTVRDDDGATSEVTHPVTVNPPPPTNGPPVAVADNYSTPAGQPLTVDASTGVLANDTDPESNPLSVQSNTQPAQGIVIVGSDGSFQYFPGGASGTQDTFDYTVSDGTSTASATVTINIQ